MRVSGRGLFITFEGVEGSGKSSQIRRLARLLRRKGMRPLATREPGGTPLGESLRGLLLDPDTGRLPPLVELLLVAAARAEHIERVIRPALEAGRIVLCDRYLDATLAYQGYGRGLSLGLIRRVHSVEPLTLRPDLTVLLSLPVETGLERALLRNGDRAARRRRRRAAPTREGRTRGDGRGAAGRRSRSGRPRESRFDEEPVAFHRRVAAGYERLVRSSPRRFRVVDATGTPSEVAGRVAAAVLPRMARRRRRKSRR